VPDPRVERTREHVLTVTRRVLLERPDEPLTFSLLSRESQISRKTLYAHWGDVETLIRESLRGVLTVEDEEDLSGLSTEQILRGFLKGLRANLSDPLMRTAVSALINDGTRGSSTRETILRMGLGPHEHFRQILWPISLDGYCQLVGPLFLSELVFHQQASDQLIENLVVCGMQQKNFPDQYVHESYEGPDGPVLPSRIRLLLD